MYSLLTATHLLALFSHPQFLKQNKSTYLRNIPIETQRPTDPPAKDNNRAIPARQPSQDPNILQPRPNRLQHRRYAVPDNHRKRHHPPKRKRPLRKAYDQQSPSAEAELHGSLERVPARHLRVDDDQPDGPVDDDGEDDEEREARGQAGFLERVRLPDDPGAEDGVRHVGDGGVQGGRRTVEGVVERERGVDRRRRAG